MKSFIYTPFFLLLSFPVLVRADYQTPGEQANPERLNAHMEDNVRMAIQNADYVLSILAAAQQQGYIGEDVSQLEHALQAADYAKKYYPYDDEFIIAALFHDIGHLLAAQKNESMGEFGVRGHEYLGSDFLKKIGFSSKVCQLVIGHVQAKRYLCATDSSYFSQLTDASKQTLNYQGGAMNEQEVKAFEKDPLYEHKITIRMCDEHAKIKDKPVPSLADYRQRVIDHLSVHVSIQ